MELGVAISNPGDPAQISAYTGLFGRAPNYFEQFKNWTDVWYPNAYNNVTAVGGKVIFTWQPTGISLTTITSGAQNSVIDAAITAIKGFGGLIYIRFAQEMNGNWFPWGTATSDANFVAAWQYLVNRFAAAGVTNVKWIWCPNIDLGVPVRSGQYPGDSYVDVIGVDGYNYASTQSISWRSFTALFSATLTEIAAITTSKPLWVCETGCIDVGGHDDRWLLSAFLTEGPALGFSMMCYFDFSAAQNFLLTKTLARQYAWQEIANDVVYGGTLSSAKTGYLPRGV